MRRTNWFRPRRVIILDSPPLPEKELAGAFGYALDELRMKATLQLINELEQDALKGAYESVGNAPVCANCLGGAEHLAMLRDRILELQRESFGQVS